MVLSLLRDTRSTFVAAAPITPAAITLARGFIIRGAAAGTGVGEALDAHVNLKDVRGNGTDVIQEA